nr:MAG TPA: hypothetical protein [Microviridae sp.]
MGGPFGGSRHAPLGGSLSGGCSLSVYLNP